MTASPDTPTDSATRTILVTDSGLGGLSVFNAIANRLAVASPWPRVKLVYVNAWPAPHRGYNHFDSEERRIRVFDNALGAMAAFDPDIILIACNTLSVIYPRTRFCRQSPIPVAGIVDDGVQMIHDHLTTNSDSNAVILGTPTTIAARSHETALVRLGIAENRIVTVGCTNLAGWIEREPFSETVHELIRQFVQEAAHSLKPFSGPVAAALCCTHFGYRQDLFEAAFAEYVRAPVTLLNPNVRMAERASKTDAPSPSIPARIDRRIVSKAAWTAEQMAAYEKLMPDMAPATRQALTAYTLDPDLFSVE